MIGKVIELGTFEEIRDGVPLKFKVSTVPQELSEVAVELMTAYFIPREPLCTHLNLADDPAGVESFRNVWRNIVKGGTALIAIKEGPGDEKDRVVGVNMTCISSREDKVKDIDNLFGYIYEIVMDITNKANLFERYGIDKYLSAVGLCVPPEYRGYHIGERLLECRKPLCEAIGIKMTGTVFTNPISIHLAEKVGFEHVYEEQYSDYRYKGEQPFKGLKGRATIGVIVFSS